jgi:adenylate cyclase class IV
MKTYEIEIKSLLGNQDNADSFRTTLIEQGAEKETENKQLNHYFINGDFQKLIELLSDQFDDDQYVRLVTIVNEGQEHSVRTREVDGVVKFVIKASVDDTSSANGIARMEFEEDVKVSLDDLDQLLLEAGFEYQAKWSREREEYRLDDVAITLDKNAGYGWLTEFELVVDDPEQLSGAESRIRELMARVGVEELEQDRLARMFDHYNNNWADYYGTDNIFTIE